MVAELAEEALDAGVEDVLACSLTPFGNRLAELPPMVLDAAVEIPTYGDHFSGRPDAARLSVGGQPFSVPTFDLSVADRVLTRLDPRTPEGLGALLGPLRAGAAVVLLVAGDQEAVIAQEQVTAVVDADGLHRLR